MGIHHQVQKLQRDNLRDNFKTNSVIVSQSMQWSLISLSFFKTWGWMSTMMVTLMVPPKCMECCLSWKVWTGPKLGYIVLLGFTSYYRYFFMEPESTVSFRASHLSFYCWPYILPKISMSTSQKITRLSQGINISTVPGSSFHFLCPYLYFWQVPSLWETGFTNLQFWWRKWSNFKSIDHDDKSILLKNLKRQNEHNFIIFKPPCAVK